MTSPSTIPARGAGAPSPWHAPARAYQLFALLGSFLLFTLEPMVGRGLLPAYGGGIHVWTTCLMLFQGLLLAGYLYAHFVAPRIGRWHLAVAALALLFLPIGVAAGPGASSPVLSILRALVADIAVPFAVLATTGVVAQAWLRHSSGAEHRDPYVLYAASNAGSLLGLLAYPLLVEPLLGLRAQQQLWTLACAGYLLLALWVAPPQRVLARAAEADDAAGPAGRLGASAVGYCLLLSAAPSISLMAVTNFLSAELGSIPLVWVAPLAVYLASFVLVFGRRSRVPRLLERFWPELALAALALFAMPKALDRLLVFAIQLLALFAICLVGHAELHRVRPHPRQLTAYYLVVASGGWLGGIFVAIAAPHLFAGLHEYPIGVGLLMLTLAVGRRAELRGWLGRRALRTERVLRALAAGPPAAAVLLWLWHPGSEQTLATLRNHYGIYRVFEQQIWIEEAGARESLTVRHLVHSGVTHGIQARDAARRATPAGYYHPAAPLGEALALLAPPRRLGVIGLGPGASAAHLGPGEEVVFYELDRDNERLAREFFSYLDDARARVRVVIGDARVELARDPAVPDGSLDALLIDAFNGDAIPTHLLTLEALELYLRKLRPDGLLICHISNRFYDLRPVLKAGGAALGLHAAFRLPKPAGRLAPLEFASSYQVLSRDAPRIGALVARGWTPIGSGDALPRLRPWSDDFVNVLAPLWQRLTRAG